MSSQIQANVLWCPAPHKTTICKHMNFFSNNGFYSGHVENTQETRAEKILEWIAVSFETSPRKLLVAEQTAEFFLIVSAKCYKQDSLTSTRNNCVSLYVHIDVGLRLFLNWHFHGTHAGEIGPTLVLPSGKAWFYFGRYGNTESAVLQKVPCYSVK